MGNKKNKNGNAVEDSKVPTILSDKTRISGDVTVAGDLKIGGYVEGDVVVSGKVIIAESGRVFGNVEAMDALIQGKVNGDICVAGLLQVDTTGQVVGDLKYELVEIQTGGKVRGTFQPLKTEEKESFKERHLNVIGDKINGLSVVRGTASKQRDANTLDTDVGETAHW